MQRFSSYGEDTGTDKQTDRQTNESIRNKIYYNIELTHKKLKPGLVTSYDLQPRNGAGLFYKK